jgi:hypothetical protein
MRADIKRSIYSMAGDLHVHTTASDGLLSPSKIIEEAAGRGLSFIAITDHDTTAAIEEATKAGTVAGVTVIPGIELNTEYKGKEMHILGYFVDIYQKWFQELLAHIKNAREARAHRILDKLKTYYGMDIPWDLVQAIAGSASIGRPHIARAMLRLGLIKDMGEAFNNYISQDSPAYVPRYKMIPEEAIGHIRKLGGVAVVAHPGLLADKSAIFHAIDNGVDGLEVYHTKHDGKDEQYLKAIADNYRLIVTGGSDCHGELVDGDITLGAVKVPDEVMYKLKDLHVKRSKPA